MENKLTKNNFFSLGLKIFSSLKDHEELTLSLVGEETNYLRFNKAKIRQSLHLIQGNINLNFTSQEKTCSWSIPFQQDLEQTLEKMTAALGHLRTEAASLPEDPFLVKTQNNGPYEKDHEGTLPPDDELVHSILSPGKDLDLVGIYSGGRNIRANMNSKGQKQWFSTTNFLVDFSLYDADQNAVKGYYGGQLWDQESYNQKISQAKEQLELMKRPRKKVSRGSYRTYFAPAAVSEILTMMSWGGVSAASFKKSESALGPLADNKKSLSPKFSLLEDFKLGLCPPFNEYGELSNDTISLIEKGQLKNLLTNSKTAKEYDLKSNGANQSEGLRSPLIKTGGLKKENILKTLGTGLYLSNLHYLNWSDMRGGRMTGMTRFACFWVEDGKIVAPIEDLRFDESLYNFWGEQLVDLTNFSETFPEPGTYSQRGVGGVNVPGMIVENFSFTL